MESLFRYVTAPHACGYLPDRDQRMEYEYVGTLTPAEYLQRIYEGWRHFGTVLFHPVCEGCCACQAIRISVADFLPDRSQKRVRKLNESAVRLRIGEPAVTKAKLALYDRFHAFQSAAKGWPEHPGKDVRGYVNSFVHHPFAVEEWCYYLGAKLVGVGYVDHLPSVAAARPGDRVPLDVVNEPPPPPLEGGLSAIYFVYDPDERQRSLGIWNVLCTIAEARRRGLPYVYLGYYVEGCQSMAYKMRFAPNQLRHEDGTWRDFRG
jgi:arginyl-tRNA--protein-N-Asp/Glu arginylyltransferase